VEIYSLQLLFSWLVALLLLGWLVLPFSHRIFPHLPDGGLAAGRVLSLLIISLFACWGASLHLLSLRFAPLLVFGLPIGCGLVALSRLVSYAQSRLEAGEWLRSRRRALLASELVFLGAFLFFAFLRLFHPSINEFEKPMDCAIIGALAKTNFLPAENPWFAGTAFTNYYYFGHLMGALLMRSFATPLPYAYNLIQAAFCALFLSTFWSLCAALCRSIARGTAVMGTVALCGNFEPLRQWLFLPSGLNRSISFPFLDWWSTSRVISGTINEYPFFTLALGDAHAHFFALTTATLILCSGFELIQAEKSKFKTGWPADSPRLLLMGALIVESGALLMTNTWDFPVYVLFSLGCLAFSSSVKEEARNIIAPRICEIFAFLLLPLLVALPFLARYKPQIGGFHLELWLPPGREFLLIWGGFLLLWALNGILQERYSPQPGSLSGRGPVRRRWLACFALIALLCGFISSAALLASLLALFVWTSLTLARFSRSEKTSRPQQRRAFILILAGCGLICLLLPWFGYLNGFFGGALRHQDTVFKFGLTGWLLLGTASLATLINLAWPFSPVNNSRKYASGLLLLLTTLLWIVPFCGTLSVIQARLAPGTIEGASPQALSLDGTVFLPTQDREAIAWLANHAPPDSTLIEPIGRDETGRFVAAYNRFGLVSALSGVPAYIGWPQHAGFWGAHPEEVRKRLLQVDSFYHDSNAALLFDLFDALPSPGQAVFCYSSPTFAELRTTFPHQTFVVWSFNRQSFHARQVFRSGGASIWRIERVAH
jgi:YYY domain-containing protein